MKKYPSIEQLRNVIKKAKLKHDYKGRDADGNPIYQHTEKYPTLKFKGSVKLHGTNSSVVMYADGRVEYQSRENVLTLKQDNAGFMAEMINKDLSFLFANFKFTDYIAIYGEWCGGNIQKGVAINGLPKMFVIFGVKIDDVWVDLPSTLHDNENGIYNILQFQTYEVDIDLNQPELAQNKIIEMTIEVESSCPVGKWFGKEGIGEGIVFTCTTDSELQFKSKGEKHSVSKVKTLSPIDVELVNSINEFVEMTVTENRLNQGLSYLKENNIEFETKNIGQFLGWVIKDVLKEESDTIQENKLDEKKVKNAIMTKARVWYFNHL